MRQTRTNFLGGKSPEQRRRWTAHGHATTASNANDRDRRRLDENARRDDRWLVGEANSLNGRAMCAVAAVTGGLGRTRPRSATFGGQEWGEQCIRDVT